MKWIVHDPRATRKVAQRRDERLDQMTKRQRRELQVFQKSRAEARIRKINN